MRRVIEETWGWDAQWQQREFERRFSSAPYCIIESKFEQPIGTLCVEHRADCHYILELQLVPEAQGRGIGTAIVQMVIENARKECLPVRLSVVPANERAQRLYERLGFRVAAVEPPFIRMVREHGKANVPPN